MSHAVNEEHWTWIIISLEIAFDLLMFFSLNFISISKLPSIQRYRRLLLPPFWIQFQFINLSMRVEIAKFVDFTPHDSTRSDCGEIFFFSFGFVKWILQKSQAQRIVVIWRFKCWWIKAKCLRTVANWIFPMSTSIFYPRFADRQNSSQI